MPRAKSNTPIRDCTVSFRITEAEKNQLEELFNELGLTMGGAIAMFFKQCLINRGLPFIVNANRIVVDGLPGYSYYSAEQPTNASKEAASNSSVFNEINEADSTPSILQAQSTSESSTSYKKTSNVSAKGIEEYLRNAKSEAKEDTASTFNSTDHLLSSELNLFG